VQLGYHACDMPAWRLGNNLEEINNEIYHPEVLPQDILGLIVDGRYKLPGINH